MSIVKVKQNFAQSVNGCDTYRFSFFPIFSFIKFIFLLTSWLNKNISFFLSENYLSSFMKLDLPYLLLLVQELFHARFIFILIFHHFAIRQKLLQSPSILVYLEQSFQSNQFHTFSWLSSIHYSLVNFNFSCTIKVPY